MLAGIWEIAEYKGDSRVAFAILTDEPNELVAPYHDRMPLALSDDKVDAWLDLSIESPHDPGVIQCGSPHTETCPSTRSRMYRNNLSEATRLCPSHFDS